MPLADKIIELRKKQGWSQIDLADRLDVSRQSVSKWEMAQAVPELDKIIKMSELFAVTTDFLLKENAPAPGDAGAAPPPPSEQPPQPAPEPEPEPGQEEPPADPPKKPRRRKWPWVLAAALLLALSLYGLLAAADVLFYRTEETTTERVLVEGAVVEEPAGSAIEQTAMSDPDAPEDGMTVYSYTGSAAIAGSIDPETLAAIAEEYAPYGITCEDGQWYLDGQPIRVFTDVLTSNGESLTGGDFEGVIRNFSGEGLIDVRTVRDFDHPDEQGYGTLLTVERCDIRLDSPRWEERPIDGPLEAADP